MYGDYIKEQRGDDIIETSFGFASYRFLNEKQVYLIDIYVAPEFRNRSAGTELTQMVCKIAKDRGCSELIGSVAPQAKDSTKSMKLLLGYGMTLQSASNDLIIFKKELV